VSLADRTRSEPVAFSRILQCGQFQVELAAYLDLSQRARVNANATVCDLFHTPREVTTMDSFLLRRTSAIVSCIRSGRREHSTISDRKVRPGAGACRRTVQSDSLVDT